jgi:hypothetical protein
MAWPPFNGPGRPLCKASRWQDAASSRLLLRRRTGGPLGDIDALRPAVTPLAITHDNGAICAYHEVGQTVSFE